MLEFSLEGKLFALETNTSIRLTWKNPACNINDFPGDIGLGIDIPVNEINRKLLGNPERFERYSKKNIREFKNFEIRYGGVLLMGGTLIIQSANNQTYSGYLRSDVGNLGEEFREKYIYDSISFNREKTFENKPAYDPLTDDYCCPLIHNPDFFKEKGNKIPLPVWTEDLQYYGNDPIEDTTETEDLTEAFRKAALWNINSPNLDGTIKAEESSIDNWEQNIELDLKVYVVSPFLFLNYTLKTLIKDAGFYLDDNFLESDQDLRKLCIYNNYDITNMIYDVGETEQYIVKFNPTSNIYRAVMRKAVKISRDYTGTFIYKSLLPKIKLKDLFLSIQNLLNLCFHFHPRRRIVDIIDRESILAEDPVDISQYLVGFWQIEEKKDSTLKFEFTHDSADTFFAGNFENLDDRRDDEREPVETWEDLKDISDPQPGEIRKIKSLNKYVQYSHIPDEYVDPVTEKVFQTSTMGWEVISIGFQNAFFNYGKQEEETIPTKFSTLQKSDSNDITKGLTLTHQKGNIKSQQYAYESFSPRLLFYNEDNTGSYRSQNIALDWEKQEIGLLESRWKNWARFWAHRQPVSCKADFPLGMLDYVIKNIYRKFRGREGEFIIEEITTEFSTDQIGESEIKGYKINYAPNLFSLSQIWSFSDMITTDQEIDFGGLEFWFPMYR